MPTPATADRAQPGSSIAEPAPDAARARAAARLPERIAFLGFGLIGGSIAMALRAAGSSSHLVAWTPSRSSPVEGIRLGIVDSTAPTPAAAVADAGLIVLAGPPLAVLSQVDDLAGGLARRLHPDAIITDVASTKRAIVSRAAEHRLRFVGGHPMAGRETSGVASATADLFLDRPWVVVPWAGSQPADVDRVESLAVAVGARPVTMRADEHDDAVAAISHLPLVVAAALVESVVGPGAPDWAAARRLAASGWSDMTRLARGDAAMGAGILATNAANVAERLRSLRAAIDAWITELEADDVNADALRTRLVAARAALGSGVRRRD